VLLHRLVLHFFSKFASMIFAMISEW
jgi:hypothetical protein